jgi:CRP-like cAMP-binding protein
MSEIEPALVGAPIFKGFEADEIRDVIALAEPFGAAAGHVFLREGEVNRALHVIRSGAVRVERIGVDGPVQLAVLEAGALFGEMSFLDGSATTATVVADRPTEVLRLGSDRLASLVRKRPTLSALLLRNIALELKARLVAANELIDHYVDLNRVLAERPGTAQLLGL